MRDKSLLTNIDNSNPTDYPNGRIQNNSGASNGTPVNEYVYGDVHEMKDKLMRLYGITYNGLPDNETNGYQLIDALIALASKNDFLIPLTTSSSVLNINLKLGKLKDQESFISQAAVNKTNETTIKGSDNVVKPVIFIGDFKANEYVRVINRNTDVLIIRLVDLSNLNLTVTELNYLKAANLTEVIAGVLSTKAVTPETFLGAFAEYVIGTTSDNFLASLQRNGLYSSEHFEIVANLGSSPIKNIGSFSGLDPSGGIVGTNFAVSGQITAAQQTFTSGGLSVIRCTMQVAMSNTNYKVNTIVQSQAGFDPDSRIQTPLFVPISATQFDIAIRESSSSVQNLKIHLDVIQL